MSLFPMLQDPVKIFVILLFFQTNGLICCGFTPFIIIKYDFCVFDQVPDIKSIDIIGYLHSR
jgi:hypothetical protein